MKPFMDDAFLLDNDLAVELFEHIRQLPIIDYHCHLNPAEIAEDKHFRNITELWLGGDHYKWRLMRADGVEESLITGDASDDQKFAAWCRTVEDCVGSPLYHWAHMELRRYFGYDSIITGERAGDIYAHCNAIIEHADFSARAILKQFDVRMLATTDDPADTLSFHQQIQAEKAADMPEVIPAFRPSKALDIENTGFAAYITGALSAAAGMPITNWDSLLAALAERIDFFNRMGCRASDHALDPPVFDLAESRDTVERIFKKALRGEPVTAGEAVQYKTSLLVWLGEQYAQKGWVMQLHMGAQRNNNTRMFRQIGADTGFDAMSDTPFSIPLARLLDTLEQRDTLPKTILYALNPNADDMLSTMIGNFQGRGIKGRMQWGCPWWFNDNLTGIRKHLVTLANNGLLARFIGMLTDSRSFMSYPRHEYFRRILAQTLAGWVERGEFPCDTERLKRIAGDIAYNNAAAYFHC